MRVHSTVRTGMLGTGVFTQYAALQGWQLWQEYTGKNTCDFIADTPDGLIRVEVKASVSQQNAHKNYYYTVIGDFNADKFDYLFVYTTTGCYWIPSSELPDQNLSIKADLKGKYERYKVDITAKA